LELKYSAEIVRAASKIKRSEANEIVKRLLTIYEDELGSASKGKAYQECFDVVNGFPTTEYLEFYKKMKEEIHEMGVPLNL
jgi:methylamine--corrinoid protein Co-methyltransferase